MDKVSNKCPLCGGDNACAMAAGEPAADCWCVSVNIPSRVIDAIPSANRGQRCICRSCAEREGGERK